MRKGKKIRFIAGKYARKDGWIDEAGESDEAVTSVIVNLGRRGEKSTYVYSSSFRIEEGEKPDCYAEAIIQQCPDIEKDLVGVCRKLAKCEIEKDEPGLLKVINKTMADAVKWQQDKGSKAYYRKIKYA